VPCASPGYVRAHGVPQAPEELEKHDCFTYEYVTPRNLWRFRDPSGHERAVRVGGSDFLVKRFAEAQDWGAP
jgi:hypothetical protein